MVFTQFPDHTISSLDPHPRRRVAVLDSQMSYVDVGEGEPIVFLHGNPTSSYLWRNVIPHVLPYGRCLAPDLIGFGHSGKSATSQYRFNDHARYLDAWFEALGLDKGVTLVLHDWGSALGFYRAFRFPKAIRAIVYLEAIAVPVRWSDFGEAEGIFRALRSPAGERMTLDENLFIEELLPRGTLRRLTDDEMNTYRAPFVERASRWPMLVWPREIPIEGEPADVTAIVDEYGQWLAACAIPKLLILGEPGAIVTGRARAFCESWTNQRVVAVKGRHFLPEDSPHQIGDAIADFLSSAS